MPEPMVPLAAKVDALRQACAYQGRPGAVSAVETHMSWVFLTTEHVFKLKKPTRSDGLDCSTLAARRFFCIEELRLNRRLAPWVYLDVVALRQGADGALRVDAEGDVVDWLVMMRRLSADCMLDHLIAQRRARAEYLAPVAALLAAFYRGLPPAITDPRRYHAQLAREIDRSEAKLCDPELGLASEPTRALFTRLRARLRECEGLLAARVGAGWVVEGHGDLRPEHVWLGTPPAVIDCLEFSLELRTLDSADELGFLALECERLGAADVGTALLAQHRELSGDAPAPALVDLYQALRACVRAGIALWHLKEPRYQGSPVWRARAMSYLQLAAARLQRCSGGPAGTPMPTAPEGS